MNSSLTQKIGAISILSTLLTVTIAPGIARADIPGNHPHYLHARSDLRKAEQLLQIPDEANVKEEVIADRDVRAAILEIDRASVLDRKDVDDYPAIDTSLTHRGKFNEIKRLLQSAKRDISLEEDNQVARAWRRSAHVEIDRAIGRVDMAMRRDRSDDRQQHRD